MSDGDTAHAVKVTINGETHERTLVARMQEGGGILSGGLVHPDVQGVRPEGI